MFWRKKKPIGKSLPQTVEVSPEQRREILKELTGHASAACDMCGSKVTQGNLASWDQDGNVYCDQHTHKVVLYRTGDLYHHTRTPPDSP